jgi:hypothetical protein
MAVQAAVHTTIHIVVEVSKTDKRKLEFHHAEVTGKEIKDRADVPLDSDLARRVEGKLELVTNDETVTIKNGDHFVALPPGTIS